MLQCTWLSLVDLDKRVGESVIPEPDGPVSCTGEEKSSLGVDCHVPDGIRVTL